MDHVYKSEELIKEENKSHKIHLPAKFTTAIEAIAKDRKKLLSTLIIVAAIPLTVGLALSQTNFFNRAAELPATPVTPPGVTIPVSTSATPTPPSTKGPTLTPTPVMTVPICVQSTIPPGTGYAPFTVTLYGGGQAGGKDSLVVGYQWDFEKDGTWDTAVSINPVKYVYQKPGTYYPKYRILGSNKLWSQVCNYKYPVIVGQRPTPTPTPVPVNRICSACSVKQSNGRYLVGGVCGVDGKTLCQCSGNGIIKSSQVCSRGCLVKRNTYDVCK